MKKLILILSLGICFTQTADVDNNKSSSNISDKKNSIGIGLTTNKSPTLIQYTRDYKLSDNYAIFGVVGLINLGLGIAWQSNYNANGMMIVGPRMILVLHGVLSTAMRTVFHGHSSSLRRVLPSGVT